MYRYFIFCVLLSLSCDVAFAKPKDPWGFYRQLVGSIQDYPTGYYRYEWRWYHSDQEIVQESFNNKTNKLLETSRLVLKDGKIHWTRKNLVYIGTLQPDGTMLFKRNGFVGTNLQTSLDAQGSYHFAAVKVRNGVVTISKDYPFYPRAQPTASNTTQTLPKKVISNYDENDLAIASKMSTNIAQQASEKIAAVDKSTPRELTEAELKKLSSQVQKSKAQTSEAITEIYEKERQRIEQEREYQLYQEQLEREARAERRANQQMYANAIMHGLNTLNQGLQQGQAELEQYRARQNDVNEQLKSMALANQSAQASSASQQSMTQSSSSQINHIQQQQQQQQAKKNQEMQAAALAERQRLAQESQRKKELEQKRQAEVLAQQKREADKKKAQQEAEIKRRQEEITYNQVIRASTRVGAISCTSKNDIHLVGVMGKAKRPGHVYNDCRVTEVRYRCPSESSWTYYQNQDWLLNAGCRASIGNDVVVTANCPAEQLSVEASKFSCDLK